MPLDIETAWAAATLNEDKIQVSRRALRKLLNEHLDLCHTIAATATDSTPESLLQEANRILREWPLGGQTVKP